MVRILAQLRFVFRKNLSNGYIGSYRRLFEQQGEVKSNEEREKALLTGKGKYKAQQHNFSKIPGSPVAYWVSDAVCNMFDAKPIAETFIPKLECQQVMVRDLFVLV